MPKKLKIILSLKEAEIFVREKLNDLGHGGLMELSKKIDVSYPTLNNFKNSKNQFKPTKLILKCLDGLGYVNIDMEVEITYSFDEGN